MQRNIVLDTNCLLQIIARKSKNYFLWERFLNGDYCLCFTTEILEEYEEILCLKNESINSNYGIRDYNSSSKYPKS